MSARLAYGDILRHRAPFSMMRNQRVLFLRYLSPAERRGRAGGKDEFLGMTIKPSDSPLGHKKMGQIEFFPDYGWVRENE